MMWTGCMETRETGTIAGGLAVVRLEEGSPGRDGVLQSGMALPAYKIKLKIKFCMRMHVTVVAYVDVPEEPGRFRRLLQPEG